MTRRAFMPAAVSGAALGANAATPAARAILDIRYSYLRNNADNQRQRLSDFLQKSVMPALKRAGGGPFGVFQSNVAPDSPFIMTLTSYPSLAAMEEITNKLFADEEYTKGMEAMNAMSGLPYQRQQRMLLRGFPSMPQIEVPAQGEGRRGGRLFEVRTYESNNTSTLRRKIGMFDNGEIAIFRKSGMTPVFFGETIVGPKMPNLTYMLAYDDMAHREKCWRAFGSDPEWAKLRATPGLSDPEVVSNISNFFVSPLAFSQIR